MGIQGIGARAVRKEDKRFITGAGRYVDDMKVPNMKYAMFVRSPYAHAEITNIDVSAAEEMEGVYGVLTGKQLKADGIGNIICGWMIHSKDGSPMNVGAWSPLALDKVRYVGEAIAIVVAETKALARDAAEAVDITYNVLPAVLNMSKAMEAGSPQIHPEAQSNLSFDWEIGDEEGTTAAFAKADRVISLDLINNRLIPNAIEPRAAIGYYDKAEDHYTCWTTSQNPHVARLVMSAFYNIAPENKLRIVAPDVGGGFGSKIYIYPEEICCLWASKRTGVPIKWVADRTESFLTDAHARDHETHAEMALDAEHNILGLRVSTRANLGAYMSLFSSATPTYLYATLLSGQYRIPAIHANVKAVYTTTTPVDAYRGAGRPEATYVVETLMDTAAREIGMSPAEFRRRNFITSFPYQTPVIMNYDAGNFGNLLDAALKAVDYDGIAKRKEEAKSRGMLRGIGMSCYIEACGIAPSAAVGSLGSGVGLWESAEIRVNAVGTIEILTGSHSHGQGHETTFAQLVSDRFGVPIDQVSVIHGDTDKVQMGMGTYGSRSGPVGMSAVVKALDKVEAKAKQIAAHMMEADEGDIVVENGTLKVAGTDKNVPWFQMALSAYTAHNLPSGMEPGLVEKAFYDPTNFTFPSGCYICEVEVDPETGKTEVIQFVAADDFGNIINPMIVEGQVHGGVAQGVGQAMLEGAVYDSGGELLTASYMDYTMPRADDMPTIGIIHSSTPCPGNPLGIKGCGEAGAIGSPPAVMNAIKDAIGTSNLTMPATPLKVWTAMQSARAG